MFALVCLGWFARLRGLGLHSLWLDEALEVGRAASSLQVVLRSRLTDMDPPLFPAFLHFWLHLGVNDFLVRFPGAAFNLLGVVLVYVWLRRHGQASFALIGAGVFALVPVQVHYAQEVNQYALIGPLAAATLLAFDRVLDSRTRLQVWPVLIFALVSAVAVYTYYGLIWLILALDLHWLWQTLRVFPRSRGTLVPHLSAYSVGFPERLGCGLPCVRTDASARFEQKTGRPLRFARGDGKTGLRSRHHRRWRPFLAYQGAMVLCALSLLPFSLEGHVLRGLAAWKGHYAQLARGDVVQQFLGGLHGSLIVFATLPFSQPPHALIAPLYLLLLLGLFAVARRRVRAGGRLIFPLVVGPLLAFVASGYGLYPFQGRHLLFAAPLLYGLLGAGVFSLHRLRPLLAVTCAAVAAMLVAFWTVPVIPSNPWLEVTSREELRPILIYVSQAMAPGDGVYVYYGAAPACTYYRMAGLAPEADVVQAGWPAGEIEEQVEGALRAADGKRRLWLIFSHITGEEDRAIVRRLVRAGFTVADRVTSINAAAYLLVLPPTADR